MSTVTNAATEATTNNRKRNLTIFGIIAAIVVTLGMGVWALVSDPIGASFSDSEDGTVEASVGTVVVDISDENTNVDLSFPNLGTDDPKSDTFTMTNSGTLSYRGSITDAAITGSSGDLTDAEDAFMVKIAVDPEQDGTFVTKLGWTALSALPSSVTLADLDSGESADVKVWVKVVNPPNTLQGAEVDGTFTVYGEEL